MTPEESYSVEETQRVAREYVDWLPRTMDYVQFPRITLEEAPKYADFDFKVLVNGVFDHYIEVKIRSNEMGRWKQTKVPLRKHAVAEHFMNDSGTKMYFVCGFTDSIGVLPLWEEPDEQTEMLARYDRGDEQDLYAMYKVSRFRRISE